MTKELFSLKTTDTHLVWQLIGKEPPLTGNPTGKGHLKIIPLPVGEVRLCGDVLDSRIANSILPGPALYEQTSYRVSLKSFGAHKIEIRHADPEIQSKLMPLDSETPDLIVGEVNFRSQVGYSSFEVWLDDQKNYTFEVEVYPTKLEYKEDFQQMLAEVQDILAGLAFEYLKSTYMGSAIKQTDKQTALEWVLLFQHILEDLEKALRQIAQRPIRNLRSQTQLIPLHQIRKVDSSLRHSVRTGRGQGARKRLSSGVQVLEQHWSQQSQYTLDTPEHRWLASQLQRVRQKLAQILEKEQSRLGHHPKHLEQLAGYEHRLAQLQKLEPINAASTHASPGFTSLQLMGASGYREAYRAILVLQLGLRLEGNALNLSLKNIAELYEYWCYLAIVKLLANSCNEILPLDELIEIQHSGLKVRLQQGQETRTRFRLGETRIDLLYNPHLRQNALLTHKPDILLEVRKPNWPVMRAVLDAKYRIDPSQSVREQMGLPAPPQDAINVLHRYRDAILDEECLLGSQEPPTLARSVIQGVALYPYVVQDEQEFPQSKLNQVFKRIGIGALPLVPTQTHYLAGWLQAFVSSQPWELAQTNFPAVLQPALRQAASEGILIGPLNGNYAKEHFAWLKASKSYYIPYINPEHGRQWRVRWIALYLPKELQTDGIGAVAFRGKVRYIEVVDREKIATPWQSRHSQENVILYHVETWEPIRPIPNSNQVASGPMTQRRWSTRLALECAENLSELSLESVPEWQMYERLKQENLPFKIKASKVPSLEEDSPGHACFNIADNFKAVYKGGQGFELTNELLTTQNTLKPSVEKALYTIKKWQQAT